MIFIITAVILLGFICIGVVGVTYQLVVKQTESSAQEAAKLQPTKVVEPPTLTPTPTFTPVPPAHTPTLEPTPIPTQVVPPTATNTPVAVNQADVVASSSDNPPPENGETVELPLTDEISDVPPPADALPLADVAPTKAEEPLSKAMPKSGAVLSENNYIAVFAGMLVLLLIMIGATRLQRLNIR